MSFHLASPRQSITPPLFWLLIHHFYVSTLSDNDDNEVNYWFSSCKMLINFLCKILIFWVFAENVILRTIQKWDLNDITYLPLCYVCTCACHGLIFQKSDNMIQTTRHALHVPLNIVWTACSLPILRILLCLYCIPTVNSWNQGRVLGTINTSVPNGLPNAHWSVL